MTLSHVKIEDSISEPLGLTTKPIPAIAHREPCLSSLTFIPSFTEPACTQDTTEAAVQPPLRLAASFISFNDR